MSEHLPLHESAAFDRAAFEKMMEAYPDGWTVRVSNERSVHVRSKGPSRHVAFTVSPQRTIRVIDVEGTLRTEAASAEDRAAIEDLFRACHEQLERILGKRREQEAKYRAMPLLDPKLLTREDFDELLGSHPSPTALSWSIAIDAASSVMPQRAQSSGVVNSPAWMLFVRCRNPHVPVGAGREHTRVWVYDVEGDLRTSAASDEEREFLAEMVRLARPALARMRADRTRRIEEVVASAPKIDRASLVEAVRAMTHGRADVAPIVDAVMLAAEDPRRYVKVHAALCAPYFVHEPVEGLHVIALLQHVPKAFVAYFDWKESMHEVLPMIAKLVEAGSDVVIDVERFRDKCDAWDRRSRIKAIAEVAASIEDVLLLELKTDSDSHAIVCVSAKEKARVRAWKKKAHLPLSILSP